MNKIQFFFAAVYQSIKSRRPDGTPYFNLCLGITGTLLLNLVNFLLILKIWFHTNLLSPSEGTFIAYFLCLSVFIMFLLRVVIPIDVIRDIEVDQRNVRRLGLVFISYFMLNVAFMTVLLILSRPGTVQH
jgi:hypothetical protein